MHSSLMSSVGVRSEVTRDNMGHATVDVTENVHNKTRWEERVERSEHGCRQRLAGVYAHAGSACGNVNPFVNPLFLDKFVSA